ncbi:FtsX-like permease family protein [Patescibacteria group bacterium]|jgi:putative ABC transport system permease protein|nr:FtsX-like permease family protein [Patescibacteria group bacterium]
MLVRDIAALSTRAFKTNPTRTWLTILGMGVGTGAVVTLVGLGFGLQGIILEQIVLGDTLLSLNVTNPPTRAVELNPQVVSEFTAFPEVRQAAPMASFAALITLGDLTGNTFVQGLDPSYFRFVGTQAAAGRLFDEERAAEDRNGVILTAAMLKLFEIEDPEEAIGRRVTFRVFVPRAGTDETDEVEIKKSYTIIGITTEENQIASFMRLDELASHVPITSYERVQVRVAEAGLLDQVTDAIVARGFSVTALSKTVEQANAIFQGIQAVLAVFGGIALTVSAIGMFNTMTVTLLERTGEIGIMRTLGASSNDIKILFIAEAIIVGFMGGVVGILIGVGIGRGLNLMVNIAATNFGGTAMTLFSFPIWFLIFILTFSAIVGFLTGVFPARRAAALNPLDAIRYK